MTTKLTTRARDLYLALLVAALTGCGALGLAPPESFDERLAYAYGTHTAVLDATAIALDAGVLTSADAEDLAEIADEARALLDAARIVHDAGDIADASQRLGLAITILTELQAYLRRGAT